MDTQNLAEAAQQMSMWDMVWSSDTVTKAVMIGLIAASVWSWAIIIEKIEAAFPQFRVQILVRRVA